MSKEIELYKLDKDGSCSSIELVSREVGDQWHQVREKDLNTDEYFTTLAKAKKYLIGEHKRVINDYRRSIDYIKHLKSV
jgi:hypothetical protein